MFQGIRYTSLDPNTYVGQSIYSNAASAYNPLNNTWYNYTSLFPYYWNMADGTLTYIHCKSVGYFSRGATSWTAEVSWDK